MTKAQNFNAVLDTAVAAAAAAALAQWERDGKMDCGSCGSAMLQLDGRSALTKAAIARGLAYGGGGDVFARVPLPDGIQTQHAAVYQENLIAFRKSLEAQGFGKVIRKFWTYVD